MRSFRLALARRERMVEGGSLYMADSCVESKPSKYLFMNRIRSSSGNFVESESRSVCDDSEKIYQLTLTTISH